VEFSEQAQKAQAQDSINQFNVRNRQQVNYNNTNAINDANRFNLTNKQEIMNRNTGLTNEQQRHNKQLLVDDYNRKFQAALGHANAINGQASNLESQSARNAQGFSDAMAGAAQAAPAIAKSFQKSDTSTQQGSSNSTLGTEDYDNNMSTMPDWMRKKR
jgi:hypothetical protein